MIDFSGLARSSFFFQVLSQEETQELLARAVIREYPEGAFLFQEGDYSEHFSIILEGRLDIIKAYGTPVERIIKVLEPGEYLGEMSLVYKNHRRTASARAREAARLLEIPIRDFEELVQRSPRLAYQLMQTLIERVIENENATIQDLKEKNRLLVKSLAELQEAQAQLIAKERIETELATAYQIQKSMLPTEIPDLPGWELAAHWQPARAVSGDFYDFIPLPDGRIALVVGDVTDKGVPAALLMTVTRSTLRTAAVLAESPGVLLARANEILCQQMPMGMFVTCLVAYLDPASGRFELANAGHPLPVVCLEGNVREYHAGGLALGVYPNRVYTVLEGQLAPGERMLFYSDGLSEARNPYGEMLDNDIVVDWFRESAAAPTSGIDFLVRRLAQFTGPDAPRDDDVTLVYLHRLP